MKYFETYEEIIRLRPFRPRDRLRNIALDSLCIVDKIKGIEKDLKRKRVHFIYIHHVFRDEEKKLDRLLKILADTHSFISYSEAVNRILSKSIDKAYFIVSSDDGLKNNLRAAEILNEYGTKACFFINPGIVDNTDYHKIKQFCRSRLKFPPVEFLNWKDIEILQKMGHEIGSHTMNHKNIAESSKEEIIEECSRSYEILRARCGEVKHFAFPYGRFFHFNELGRKIVFDSGYISCASAERGCHVNPVEEITFRELCILRDHIILGWNMNHIFHFLAKSSRKASPANNYFPCNKLVITQ